MRVRIIGIRFDDEGTVYIEWAYESEQTRQGGTVRTTYITLDGQDKDEQIGYFVKELQEDASELLAAWEESQR